MKETILRHIELNETYHETKERLAWLGTTLYLSFSIAAIAWLWNTSVSDSDVVFAGLVLFAVYLAGLGFANFQFRHRWKSVLTTYGLRDMLEECHPDSVVAAFPSKYKEAIDKRELQKENRRRPFLSALFTILFPFVGFVYLLYRVFGGRKDWIDSRYHSEIPSYGVAFYLFVAQMVLLSRYYSSY